MLNAIDFRKCIGYFLGILYALLIDNGIKNQGKVLHGQDLGLIFINPIRNPHF